MYLDQLHIHSTYRRLQIGNNTSIPDTFIPFPSDLRNDILGVRSFLENTVCSPARG